MNNKILNLTVLITSFVFTVYFSIILVIYLVYFCTSSLGSHLDISDLFHIVTVVILLLVSLASLIQAIFKRPKAKALLLILFSLVTCSFLYDTQYSKTSSIIRPIIVNGEEPYRGVGYRYSYIKWIWYEKDVIRSDDFTKDKVFHHFFGLKPKGYISSSTIIQDVTEQSEQPLEGW